MLVNTPYMDAMGNIIIENHQRDWPCLTLSAQKFQTKFQGLTGENLKPEIPNMTMDKQPWFWRCISISPNKNGDCSMSS